MISLTEAAAFFLGSAVRCPELMADVVTAIVTEGAGRAKTLVGHEQDGWDPLSGATVYGFRHHSGLWITGKLDLGYGGFEFPLLRTGEMRDSVEFTATGLVGEVGSDDKRALWQELGTPGADYPIPPRPFLSKGLMEAATESLEPLMLEAMTSLLVPGG